MKLSRQHLEAQVGQDWINVFTVKSDRFDVHWHYHAAYELCYVRHGQGRRWVGDQTDYFDSGDLVFLGSNLPHTWISSDEWNESSQLMEVVVVHIDPRLWRTSWLNLPIWSKLQKLISDAQRGISFRANAAIEKQMDLLLRCQRTDQHLAFLQLISMLSLVKDKTILCSSAYQFSKTAGIENRMTQVLAFMHEQFTEPLKLSELADKAIMNPAAFCRFFKEQSGQTPFQYISQLRIQKAQRELSLGSVHSISDLAHRCGFTSQTSFNRQFRAKIGLTPSEFGKRQSAAGEF